MTEHDGMDWWMGRKDGRTGPRHKGHTGTHYTNMSCFPPGPGCRAGARQFLRNESCRPDHVAPLRNMTGFLGRWKLSHWRARARARVREPGRTNYAKLTNSCPGARQVDLAASGQSGLV